VTATKTVREVAPKTPAAGVLRPGDRIVAVDGRSFDGLEGNRWVEEFREQVGSHRCQGPQRSGCLAQTPVKLSVERDGRRTTLTVRPEYDAAAEQALVGFRFGDAPQAISAGEAVDKATGLMWEVSTKTVSVFANLLDSERRKEVSGVVGVSDAAHQTIDKFGATEALILLAVVSLSLGLVNLFPFLPLDGGHIFWSLLEKVRGRRVPFAVMERAGAIGFVLVIMLFLLGLSNDIGRLTGEGINVR
jgi:regulator of sigma E protease